MKQIEAALIRALIWIGVTLAMPVQCLFCHRFGERTLSLPRIAVASVLLPLVGMPWSSASPSLASITSYWISGWTLQVCIVRASLIALMLWHWVDIQQRKRVGLIWHSKSLGIPWSWLGPDGKSQRLYVQPALTIFIGNLFLPFNTALAGYFYLSAAACFFSWCLFFRLLRSKVLDLIDQRVEADGLRAALERKPAAPRPPSGDMIEFVVSPGERNNSPDLADIIAKKTAG